MLCLYCRVFFIEKFHCVAVSILFFHLSIFCTALWMLVIAYDNPSQKTAKLWPFIITELIMGLACPILACIGFALLSIVGTYIMAEQVDLRIIVNHMLPSVVLKEDTSGGLYWIIVQHFHTELKKPTEDSRGKADTLLRAVDRNKSTWILAIISALAVVLSVSSFINRSIVETLTVPVTEFLEESDICLTYSCFTPVAFHHLNVNCSEVTLEDLGNIGIVHCFKFIPLSSEIITNLSISVGFYLAVVGFLQVIFVAATVIHAEKSHKVWGALFIIAGFLPLIGAVVYIFLPHFVNIRLDVILAGQIVLVAIYLVLIGFLLCTGEVRVKKRSPPAAPEKADGEQEGDELTSFA